MEEVAAQGPACGHRDRTRSCHRDAVQEERGQHLRAGVSGVVETWGEMGSSRQQQRLRPRLLEGLKIHSALN